jgi:chitin disaccharide deacetylase
MRKKAVHTLRRILRHISSESIQKRLGYSNNSKLLIIHADDAGLSESENLATIEAFEKGIVNSGSIMVPCYGFRQIAEYSKANPKADLGIHLTLTSEWKACRWGPVLKPNEVPSIIDEDGMFFDSAFNLVKNFRSLDVKNELKGQIDLALKSGIDLTHIDTHMFTAFSHEEIQKIYLDLGEEYKLPVLLNYGLSNGFNYRRSDILVDNLFCAQPKHNVSDLGNYYRGVLRTLKPGLNSILLHVAFDNKEMQDITGKQTKFGSEWRQTDFDFFTSDECRKLLKEGKIQLITWREIRDKLFR